MHWVTHRPYGKSFAPVPVIGAALAGRVTGGLAGYARQNRPLAEALAAWASFWARACSSSRTCDVGGLNPSAGVMRNRLAALRAAAELFLKLVVPFLGYLGCSQGKRGTRHGSWVGRFRPDSAPS